MEHTLFIASAFLAFTAISALFGRLWVGVVNVFLCHTQPIKKIEGSNTYLPSNKVVAGTVLGTAVLFVLALQNGLHGLISPNQEAGIFLLGTVGVVLSCICLAFEQRFPTAKEYVFSFMIGSICALVLIGFQRSLFYSQAFTDPYSITLVVVTMVIAWRLLFGPWAPEVKATVLGTFIGWVALTMLWHDPAQTRIARILAGMVAFVPALIWCSFFLKYHAQRYSMVALMFFAGMLSTAPILFYDKLVRNGSELQFFFFRVVPENFNLTSSAFVTGNVTGISHIRSTLLVSFLSFMFVGCIEELSKFWVMKRSGRNFFSSIDDAMQLSIIVAIGFAFAENMLNPTYFMGFVQSYVLTGSPDWSAFIGNVVGRAVLTNMVHIVSTGVLGYFFGVALFAAPVMKEAHARGKFFWVADGLHTILGLPEKLVFRRHMFLVGLFFAIGLHGLFNFLVTFPDLLPTRPRTLGDIVGMSGFFDGIPLLLIPSLFYVVGGCWLITELFFRKENMKEHGRVVTTDTFVVDTIVA